MRTEQYIGCGVLAVLGVASLVTGAAALGMDPGSGGPACLKRIQLNTYMQSQENMCTSYTDCDEGYSCLSGAVLNSCGTPGNIDAWCADYENGTWDAVLGRCVDGHMPGSYYHNGFVIGYPSPVFCN